MAILFNACSASQEEKIHASNSSIPVESSLKPLQSETQPLLPTPEPTLKPLLTPTLTSISTSEPASAPASTSASASPQISVPEATPAQVSTAVPKATATPVPTSTAASKATAAALPVQTSTPTPIATSTSTPAKSPVPTPSKGDVSLIDYNNPNKYTVAGKQSGINDTLFTEIDNQLNIKTNDFTDIEKVFNWKNQNFKNISDGGRSVGKITVNNILTKKELAGCHDHALLTASILRRYGFPAIMVDTTGIQWAYDYPDKTTMFIGHVFVEIYLKDKWILFDPTSGKYILNYDFNNRVIPITTPDESKGYYAMLKGLDPDDYGITSITSLKNKQKEYAELLKQILP